MTTPLTDHPPVVGLLAELVGIDTTNPGGDEHAGLELLARRFDERGVPTRIDAYRDGNANLVATVRLGTGTGPTVLLNSHIDVVPAGDDWTSDPFTARIEDGRLYGRGSADAKGSLAAMAVALLSILDDDALDGTVVFTAVGDEEVGSTGARALVRDVSADACIVGEPTDLRLMTAHKGSVRPVVEVRGIAAHAATPHAGANAIVGSRDLLDRLAGLAERLTERGHPLVGAPTLTPVLVSGGEAPNAVPERVRITIDRRLVPGETADQAVAEIQEVLDSFSAANAPLTASVADLAPSTGGPSETPQDHPFVLAARTAMAAIGEEPALAGLVVNCDMTTFRAAGIPTLVLGPGTLAVMHTRDEYVETEQLDRAVVAYREILRTMLTPASC